MDWQLITVVIVLSAVFARAFYWIWRRIKNVDNPCHGCNGCNLKDTGALNRRRKCHDNARKDIKYLRE